MAGLISPQLPLVLNIKVSSPALPWQQWASFPLAAMSKGRSQFFCFRPQHLVSHICTFQAALLCCPGMAYEALSHVLQSVRSRASSFSLVTSGPALPLASGVSLPHPWDSSPRLTTSDLALPHLRQWCWLYCAAHGKCRGQGLMSILIIIRIS